MIALDGFVVPSAKRHATHLNTLIIRRLREVNIQANALGHALSQNLLGYLSDIGAHWFKIGIGVLIAKRESHRWDILQTALDGDSHRAAVVGIDRGIIAMVDTADNHIRKALADIGQRHFYTVNRCAVARPHLYPLLLAAQLQAQGDACREGARVSAASIVGGTDDDISYILQHVYQAVNAFGLIAVIIGNEQ